MDTSKKIRKIACLVVFGLVIATGVAVLRGPHISNALKRLILPEIEMATGQRVVIHNIYINVFPFFVEAKELRMFDEKGARILMANRIKAYLDMSGIFDRSVKIRRLVIRDPDLSVDSLKASEIIGNIRTYLLQTKKKKINVKIMAVEVQQGQAVYADAERKTNVSLRDVSGEMIIGKVLRIRNDVKNVVVRKEGWPAVAAKFSSALLLKDDTVQIQKLSVDSLGSQMTASGIYKEETLDAKTRIDLLVKTVKEIFHLGRSGDGRLDAEGDIVYRDKKISVDLKLSGKFYLQTLMELLKVNEKIEGLVDVKGEIKGPLEKIRGRGTATLQKGNLYNVEIDFLRAAVSYADGTMHFTDGDGKLYNGQARASASIALPVVNTFTVDVDFSQVDSLPLFKLIGWDPGIQPGKVTGTLHSSGAEFDPSGRFQYVSVKQGADVLGRVAHIEGSYSMNGTRLDLPDIKLRTEKSHVLAKGLLDLDKKTLNMDCVLRSGEVTDLLRPYYGKLLGKGNFEGKVNGSFEDPVISGRVKVEDAVIEGYPAGTLDADVTYRKDLFHINKFVFDGAGEQQRIGGDIYFRHAKMLFDLSGAEFKLKAAFRNAELERFMRMFYSEFRATGRFSSDFTVRGTFDRPEIHGPATLMKASLYDVPFDLASFQLSYRDKRLDLSDLQARKGASSLRGDFTLYPDTTFSYKAYSDHIVISDLLKLPLPAEMTLGGRSEGSGAFDDPKITVDAQMKGVVFKGRQLGGGEIKASVRDKNIVVKGGLLGGQVSIDARGRLEDELPWEANVDLRTGRYDFLITSYLKEVPEDLILSLNGSVQLRGTRKKISASSTIKHMVLSMYGYSFTNENEMKLDLRDRVLEFNPIFLRSGDTLLGARGGMTLGKQYNLTFEGSSALAPFKSLSSRLGLLKGKADFVMEITGDWETPKIYGGVTLENGVIGLKDHPLIVSSLNGYLYIDNDRVVLQQLAGKTGGGDIGLSGILYLRKFALKRFYVEAKLNNISTAVSKDFNVNYDGNILYKGTQSSQTVSGEITINNARYHERVEWKSWLLKAKAREIMKTEISSLENAELNIRISGKDNMYIDNNIARATVSADLILRGTVYRPVLLGRIASKEGKVYFRNNEFRILHASADFADPKGIVPVIDIAADTTVKGYNIKMNLEGQVDHFNMSLSSDPQLKEMDILSLLTVGRTSGEVKGLEGGIGAGEATSFVTGKMQDVIEERLRTIIGLDRFQIDPYVSRTTGTVGPRVTVSKRLLGDKLFVTYASVVGATATEEQLIKLEYFLAKNISLIGVRDERGIVGGDIQFRFEFK